MLFIGFNLHNGKNKSRIQEKYGQSRKLETAE
jgi:hypothetical protein